MRLYISHGAGNGNGDAQPDWFIVESRDNPADQVRSLRAAGRTVYQIDVLPWQALARLPSLEEQAAVAEQPGVASASVARQISRRYLNG